MVKLISKASKFTGIALVARGASSSPHQGYCQRQLLLSLQTCDAPRFFSSHAATSPILFGEPRKTRYSTPTPLTLRPSNRSLATMAEPVSSRPAVECIADRLEKPLIDTRSYRVIRLPNQLEALLIHDPETDKASAAMDVNVGSFSDEEDMPGMAHAVEHLLFMGTKKYPGENEYNSYLTKFGGNSNAFTQATSTNYYFELSATSTSNSGTSSANTSQASIPIHKSKAPLYGALDRFSQFFVNPLFLEDTLDRELRAVDSENKKNLQSDTWRLMQLGKSLSSPEHPFHKFSTGNYKTLHDDPIERGVKIRDEFIRFYQTHYSANRMKLAVLGRESLDELQDWTQELFSDVKDQSLPQPRWDGIPAYREEDLRTQTFAKPVMDQRNLDVYFEYPDEEDLYASRPSRYISHLIGHEGPGSILAYIKAKGWANGLSAGASPQCPGTAFFSIGIRLTEDGLKNYQEIVKTVFQYIAMIKEQPPQQWIVDEMSRLAEVDFKYRQKIPASRTTSMLSQQMQKEYPRDQLLSAAALITEFNPEAIKRGLDHLNPDTFRIRLVSQEYPGTWDKREKWYGTEYKYEKIPSDFMHEIRAAANASPSERPTELHLPAVNEFVPQRLDVEKKDVNQPAIAPKLIRNDNNVRTWWKKDDQFWVPKGSVHILLRSPLAMPTPYMAVMGQVYKELVEDSLMEYAYDAELAGLQYGINLNSQGMDVAVGGYNDKMAVLLEKVLVSIRDLEVKDDRFEIIKERLMRGYKNFEYTEPFRQITSYSRWLVSDRQMINFQLLEELKTVRAEDVRQFAPQMLRQMHLEILAHGNLYKEDALRIADLVENTLRPRALPASQWPTQRCIMLEEGSDYRYERVLKNRDNINHCVDYMIFVGDGLDPKLRAKLLLFDQMADEPVFDTLRTKEQLGYVVGSNPMFLSTVAAFRILIQSEKDCGYLEKRIDNFLVDFEGTIRDMPDDEFDAHKIGLINKRLEKLKNLTQETGRFWHHITDEMYRFDITYTDVENIEPLTKQDILDFFKKYFHPQSPTRAKISTHLIAQASAADIAANTSIDEKQDKLVEMISSMLGQLGLENVSSAGLKKRLEKVDIESGDLAGIVTATGNYMKEGLGMAANQVEEVLAHGKVALGHALPSLGIVSGNEDKDAAMNGSAEAAVNGEKSTTVVIEDVKAFKASMPLSAGPKAAKDLSFYEELGPRL